MEPDKPKTLHVENFPAGLLRKARSQASLEGLTLRDFVIHAIETRTPPAREPGARNGGRPHGTRK